MKSMLTAFAATIILSNQAVFADQMKPMVLAPIRHAQATLTIVDAAGNETEYSPAGLEEFATYSLTTTTPWRERAAEFHGVRLADILAAHGLDTVETIVVTAENDYSTTMSRDLLSTVDVLVATRVDGRAHDRRNRGPIQFIIDSETFASSSLTSESNLVWMAARIAPGE